MRRRSVFNPSLRTRSNVASWCRKRWAVRMKLTCPGVSQAPPPNFNVVDSGVGSLKLKKSSLKLGEWGGVSGQEVIWIHSLARTSAFEWRLEKASGSSKVLGD